jgi:RNA polymerase sigma-70 factor (ECF subfamily)
VQSSVGTLELVPRAVEASSSDVERQLVARLRAGELTALGEAYDSHHEQVRAFARRLLGDAAAAEDLVQETFLSLPGAVLRFREDSSLRTFVISIALNHSRHHVRAVMRRRAATARMATGTQRVPEPPHAATDRMHLAHALTRALDSLPLDQRVAIILCEVEERSSAEAAQIVGTPEATIRTRIFHAKRKLRELLATPEVR